MNQAQYQLAFQQNLIRLIQQDENPKQTLMMSMEHLPEMYQLGNELVGSETPQQIASMLLTSDQMNELMHKIIWKLEISEIQAALQNRLSQAYQDQSLMELLENLP